MVRLNTWLEAYEEVFNEAGSPKRLWVKLPSVKEGSVHYLYVYYSPTVLPPISSLYNGENVFEFFDDFTGDLSKWVTETGSGDVVEIYTDANGVHWLHIKTNGNNYLPKVYSNASFSSSKDYFFGSRFKSSAGSYEGRQWDIGLKTYNGTSITCPYVVLRLKWSYDGLIGLSYDCSNVQQVFSSGWSADTPVHAEMKFTGSSQEFFREYSSFGTNTLNINSSDLRVAFQKLQTDVNWHLYVDYVFLAKLFEPSITYGPEESGSWNIDIGGTTYTFTKRRKVTIVSDRSDKDIQVALDPSQFSDSNHRYVVFIDENYYWIEDNEKVWIVSDIPAGGFKKYRLYKKDPEEEAVVSDGLVAWYKLNGDGTDSSGNGYDGTVYGATATTDRFGSSNKAMSFDGSNDYIIVDGTDEDLRITGDITISMWVKRTGTINDTKQLVICSADETAKSLETNFLYSFGISHNGTSTFFIHHYDSGSGEQVNFSYVPPLNEWNHICVVRDSSLTKVKLYVNGVFYAEGYYSNNAQKASSGNLQKLRIGGAGSWWSDSSFEGDIDDVRIYNRVLTSDEIWQIYTASAYHNGDEVFEFFDDFNGSSLDSSKWTSVNTGGSIDVSDSILTVTGGSSSFQDVISYDDFNRPVVGEYMAKLTLASSTPDWNGIGFMNKDTINDYHVTGIESVKTYPNRWIVGDGSSSFTHNTVTNVGADSWHSYKIERLPDGVTTKFYMDGSLKVTINQDDNNESRNVWFMARAVSTYIDWVFVRKYTNTEPTVTIIDKGDYWEVNIYNVSTSDLSEYQISIPLSLDEYYPLDIYEIKTERESNALFFSSNF